MSDHTRTGPCWLLYNHPGKSQAIPRRLRTAWPKRGENKCILFKVTQMFWELYLRVLCPNLVLSSLSQTFFLTVEQTQSMPLSEVRNMYVM